MASIPKKLLFFYGWTKGATTAQTLEENVKVFSQYDIVVLSQSISQPTHGDYSHAKQLINHPGMKNVKVFGYVTLAQSPTLIVKEIDEWERMGDIYGIFCDEYGYDYKDKVSGIFNNREHQNFMLYYIHRKVNPVTKEPYRAFVNAWNQEDVFMPQAGLKHTLKPDDWTLLESYQIKEGEYVNPKDWRQKMDIVNKYRGQALLGATTTMNDANPVFNQKQLDYAYISAVLDNLDAFSWGERYYLTVDPIPIRKLPEIKSNNTDSVDIVVEGTVYKRNVNGVTVSIDTSNHNVKIN